MAKTPEENENTLVRERLDAVGAAATATVTVDARAAMTVKTVGATVAPAEAVEAETAVTLVEAETAGTPAEADTAGIPAEVLTAVEA